MTNDEPEASVVSAANLDDWATAKGEHEDVEQRTDDVSDDDWGAPDPDTNIPDWPDVGIVQVTGTPVNGVIVGVVVPDNDMQPNSAQSPRYPPMYNVPGCVYSALKSVLITRVVPVGHTPDTAVG